MLSENVKNLIKEVRKLREHAHCMEMATNYKRFNYGYIDRLIGQIVKEELKDGGDV